MKRVTFQHVDSTNEAAKRLMRSHPGERLLVAAHEQRAGKGRLGRSWLSPRGGVWMTIVQPTGSGEDGRDGAARGPALTETVSLLAGLAVYRGIAAVCFGSGSEAFEAGLRIKWPNDVWLDGRKVAGVLCERTAAGCGCGCGCEKGERAGSGACHEAVLVGIGVNADFDDAELTRSGESMRATPTTLRSALDRRVDVLELEGSIAEAFVSLADGGGLEDDGSLVETVRSEIEGRLALLGERAWFGVGERREHGVVVGLDGGGRLILECEGGERAVGAGEVDRVRGASGSGVAVEGATNEDEGRASRAMMENAK